MPAAIRMDFSAISRADSPSSSISARAAASA
jgi:hypothetical protein